MNFGWVWKKQAETAQHSSLEIKLYHGVYVPQLGIVFYWHSNKKAN